MTVSRINARIVCASPFYEEPLQSPIVTAHDLLEEKVELIFSAYQKENYPSLHTLLNEPFSLAKRQICARLTPLLHDAVEQANYEIANLFLQVKEIPRLREGGLSLMYRACRRQDFQMVDLLLRYGISHSQQNDLSCLQDKNIYWRESDRRQEHEATPLECAAKTGQIEIADLLLAAGADIDQPGSLGRAPLFHAIQARQEPIALFLMEQGAAVHKIDQADPPLISQAILSDLYRVVFALVQKGVIVDLPYVQREGTPLHDAASVDNPALLDLILKRKGMRFLNWLVLQRETPLMVAVRYGLLENVQLLLFSGARTSIKNHQGKTAADQAHELRLFSREFLLINASAEARRAAYIREQIYLLLASWGQVK